MRPATKMRILEAGIMDVCPDAKIVFGYERKFIWERECVHQLNKKGIPDQEIDWRSLKDEELENLISSMCTKLRSVQGEYQEKVTTAKAILEGIAISTRLCP